MTAPIKAVFIGDVVGGIGCAALARTLPSIRREYGADIVIVNGENSAENNGISSNSAQEIFDAGADVITTGNHAFQRHSISEEYERRDTLLRPANLGEELPGKGVCVLDMGRYSAAVINLIGTAFMKPVDNPFKCVDELLKTITAKIVIVDFHAEATSEKRAMSCYLAGRVSAVFGTHTHVQTADERITDGTGCITDVGMTGPVDSVLGVRKDIIISKFVSYRSEKHIIAQGECEVCGAAVKIDPASGKCLEIKRFRKTIEP